MQPDMPAEDFLEQMRKLRSRVDPEKVTVVITGGEPLLRKDLEEVGKELRKMNYPWGIVSNGMAYSPERHKKLMAAGMGSLTFSLDGLEVNHNWLRNNKRSFEKVKAAIRLVASEKRFSWDVVTCVNQRNIKELESIRDLLADLQVPSWRLFTIAPIGRAAKQEEMQLKPAELSRLMEFIQANRHYRGMKVNFSCEGFTGPYEAVVRDGFFFCRAGIHIGSILVDGSVSACPNIDRHAVQGSIYRKDFIDIWDEGFLMMRDRAWTRIGVCSTCDKYKWCNGNGLHLWNLDKMELQHCHYRTLLN